MNALQHTAHAFLFAALCAGTSAIAAEAYASRDPAFTRSLNGEWAFRYVPGLDAGGDGGFAVPGFDVAAWDTIPVPANWELKGFAEPSYAVTSGELQSGARGLAAPVRGVDGLRASVGVVTLEDAIDEAVVAPQVIAAAQQVADRLR